LGLYREGEAVTLYVMMVREGNLQENRIFHFKSYEEDPEILGSFLLQYYAEGRFIPGELILPADLEDASALTEILSERAGHRVALVTPQRGEKLALLRLASQNAQQNFKVRGEKEKDVATTLADLQQKLDLEKLPRSIECYDISNFQGRESVGSMVTFRDGKPYRQGYRHFKIKTVEGANDFASMYEVLRRRLRRAAEAEEEWALPDLIVIDGGKGQLNAAAQALRDQEVVGVDLVALAKSKLLGEEWQPSAQRQGPKPRSEERVFLPNRKNPVFFPPNSSALFVLVQIRDEAHRFGIEFHRKLRKKRTLASSLEQVAGIGKARRQKLLRHFGSLKRIQEAPAETIAEAIGLSLPLARRLKESL
jgi:excinuclease ABC subunit C